MNEPKINPVDEKDHFYDYYCSKCEAWYLAENVFIEFSRKSVKVTCSDCGNENMFKDTTAKESTHETTLQNG